MAEKVKPFKTPELTKSAMMDVVFHSDEYRSLVEDCQATFDQAVFRSRIELVEGMHSLGKRISTDPFFKKHAKGNQEFVQQLARDIHRNASEVYRAIAFYERFKDVKAAISIVPDGKNLSWNAVKKFLGSGGKGECKHTKTVTLVITLKKCADCGIVVEKSAAEEKHGRR